MEGNNLGSWVVKRFKSGLFKIKEIVTKGAWISQGVKWEIKEQHIYAIHFKM